MNPEIEQLYRIAQQPSRNIIGLMSGTSVDGLDIALCRCTGSGPGTAVEVLHFETVAYTDDFRDQVASVFSKKMADLQQLTLLNAWIGMEHAKMINACLKKWNLPGSGVDLIASHGQTIYHAPKTLHRLGAFGNATLQIGDGDHIAVNTGIITISDFRQKHIAAGGEGAPLAVYADYLLFGSATENRIMLNMGGIANFTWLPANGGNILSTDTGPGNTLMDAFVKKNYNGLTYDKDGKIAASGQVNQELLEALFSSHFFTLPFPKTTGPEIFNMAYLDDAMQFSGNGNVTPADIMATLNMFTAKSIAAAIEKTILPGLPVTVFASGGGMHNPVLMNSLQHLLPSAHFNNIQTFGIHPDAKEAVLFALLANECVAGAKTVPPAGIIPVSMGKISLPG